MRRKVRKQSLTRRMGARQGLQIAPVQLHRPRSVSPAVFPTPHSRQSTDSAVVVAIDGSAAQTNSTPSATPQNRICPHSPRHSALTLCTHALTGRHLALADHAYLPQKQVSNPGGERGVRKRTRTSGQQSSLPPAKCYKWMCPRQARRMWYGTEGVAEGEEKPKSG